MVYVLLIHIGIAIYILIDGTKRRVNSIPWAIGATIVGPIILPEYMRSWSYQKRPQCLKYLAVMWAIILILSGIWNQRSTTCQVKSETLEYKLALINGCGSVSKDTMEISHFGRLLDELSENYTEDRQQIANLSVITQEAMKKNGIDVSLLNMMEGLNSLLFPRNVNNSRYSLYALAYADWRKKGLSHKETIEKLQAIISNY